MRKPEDFDHIWPMCDNVRPTSAKSGLVEICPKACGTCPESGDFGPRPAKSDQSLPNLCRMSSPEVQISLVSVGIWPKSDMFLRPARGKRWEVFPGNYAQAMSQYASDERCGGDQSGERCVRRRGLASPKRKESPQRPPH